MISFNEIFNFNIPFVYAELNKTPVLTGTPKQTYTSLIVGQKLPTGTVRAETPVRVYSLNEAKGYFGEGSMLTKACEAYFLNNKSVELKVFAFNDLETGTQATSTITITGTAKKNGTVALYINGTTYKVPVSKDLTDVEVATLIKQTLTADTSAEFTASSSANIVTLTAKHKGSYGNSFKIRLNWNATDSTPIGLAISVQGFSGGVGDPNFNNLITLLSENQFNLIASPYTDTSLLTNIDTVLSNNFLATEMRDSFYITAKYGTVSSLITLESNPNTPFITILDNYPTFNTPLYQASAVIGRASDKWQSNPASSLLNTVLMGVKPYKNRLKTERNVLAGNGIATGTIMGTSVRIDRLVTTAMKDQNNVYLSIDERDLRLYTAISYVRYVFIQRMSQFQGMKLANDNDLISAEGGYIITPNIYKQNMIIVYNSLVDAGVCEDRGQFKESIIVEKDGNRLNSSAKINIINVLLQQAIKLNWEV